MKLFIKNMVSIRCKMIVKAELAKLGLLHGVVELGEVNVQKKINGKQRLELKKALMKSGLELMDDQKAILVARIKNIVIELVHYSDKVQPKVKNSIYISGTLKHDYKYLAKLFAESTGTTIEHYILIHKIERAKELIIYDELTLAEIAWKLNYKSVAHLSNQFKKITGLTPTFFKSLKHKKSITLDDLPRFRRDA